MSELNSLFAQIHITKNNFETFLKAKPTEPKLDENWVQWWNSKEMYNKSELQEKDMRCYEEPTNELIINGWIEAKESLTFSDYDAKNEIWHFGIIMFSENYFEMIPGLAFLKSVAEFKNENTGDFSIVYNYFWGDEDVSAFINYENGKGLFDNKVQSKSDVNNQSLKYTDAYLTKKFEELGENYAD